MDPVNSKWTRAPRTASALRGDRLSLVLTDTGWTAIQGRKNHAIPAPPIVAGLESAIAAADALLPPCGWQEVDGHWKRDGWRIQPQDSGWYVYRSVRQGRLEPASVREFASADRARRWVEVRLDRTGTNLRGPKPRAGRKSNCKLPDVRVTEAERSEANALLEHLGLSYSQFVRAAFRFAQTHLTNAPVDTEDWVVQKVEGRMEFCRFPESTQASAGGSERSEELLPGGSLPHGMDHAHDTDEVRAQPPATK